MWVVALDALSILILIAWAIFLIVVIAFIVMAAVEFLRILAAAVFDGACYTLRGCGRVVRRRGDAAFLRHVASGGERRPR